MSKCEAVNLLVRGHTSVGRCDACIQGLLPEMRRSKLNLEARHTSKAMGLKPSTFTRRHKVSEASAERANWSSQRWGEQLIASQHSVLESFSQCCTDDSSWPVASSPHLRRQFAPATTATRGGRAPCNSPSLLGYWGVKGNR
jgi:hypothetical protein